VSSIFCLPTGPLRIHGRIVGLGRQQWSTPARAVFLAELRVFGIVIRLRLSSALMVVEVAEELVEAMHGRKVLVVVTQVVLAELAGGVACSLSRSAMVGDQSGMPWEEPACRSSTGRCGTGADP